MRGKKGASKNAGTPFAFRTSHMDYIQIVDILLLDLVRTACVQHIWMDHRASLLSVPVPVAIPSFQPS